MNTKQNLPDLTNIGPVKIEFVINDKLAIGKALKLRYWVIVDRRNNKPVNSFVSDELPVVKDGKIIGVFNKMEHIEIIE